MCWGIEGCREAHNPGAIVIKKKKERGGSIKGSQINRTKHSHFSRHISSAPPLKETATKDVISMNWEVWLLWAFQKNSQSGSKQLFMEVWVRAGVCQPYGNATNSSQIISKGHISIKMQRSGHFRPHKPDIWRLNAPLKLSKKTRLWPLWIIWFPLCHR